MPALTRVIVPLGGGGLASGIAIAVKGNDPAVEVIGVQVSACAPYAHHSPPSGPVVTLADGIAVKRPGEITRPLVEQWLDDVVVVEENPVADAMVLFDGTRQVLGAKVLEQLALPRSCRDESRQPAQEPRV